jgi:phosphoglycerate dehydrogenase-like enzyme
MPLTVMLAMDEATARQVMTDRVRRRLAAVAKVLPDRPDGTFEPHREALAQVEVLLTGWGCPPITPEVLDAAPRLRAVVHAAGSVKTFADREVLERGVQVSSAVTANAVPVAEFAVAAIVLAGKRAFRLAAHYRRDRSTPDLSAVGRIGNYRATIGLLGASRIGRMVADRLRGFDLDVLVSDPYLDDAAALGATGCDLDTLFARSDVVSIHAPLLPGTTGLVDAALLARMRDGAVLVNTARGAIVDQAALERECASGRLDAVLDVTDPEPLPPDSALWDLPNVFVTPHLAGALGNEIERLGELAVREIEQLAANRPLQHAIRAEDWDRIA